MPALDRRQALRWLGGCVLALAIGMLPWPGLREGWTRTFTGLANVVVFDHLGFGLGGRARLRPAGGSERGTGAHVATDAIALLAVEGYQGELQLGLSSRRDGYLPLLLFLAVIGTAPLGWRNKLRPLTIGAPLTLALALATTWLGVAAVFASRVRGVYAPDSLVRRGLALGEQLLLSPPAVRFLIPLVLAVGLSLWRVRSEPCPPRGAT